MRAELANVDVERIECHGQSGPCQALGLERHLSPSDRQAPLLLPGVRVERELARKLAVVLGLRDEMLHEQRAGRRGEAATPEPRPGRLTNAEPKHTPRREVGGLHAA
jgi:hypothetical protein